MCFAYPGLAIFLIPVTLVVRIFTEFQKEGDVLVEGRGDCWLGEKYYKYSLNY